MTIYFDRNKKVIANVKCCTVTVESLVYRYCVEKDAARKTIREDERKDS